jgi:hypothetical protein
MNAASQSILRETVVQTHGLSHLTSSQFFQVAELIVLEVIFNSNTPVAQPLTLSERNFQSPTKLQKLTHETESELSAFPSLGSVVEMVSALKEHYNESSLESANLEREVAELGDEIHCVSSIVGHCRDKQMTTRADLEQPCDCEGSLEELDSDLQSILRHVAERDFRSIVTINVNDTTIVSVNKSTLQHAPSGSMLANMASDIWGHDLDSDGHFIQDVNPKLFVAIVNHLRLRALLPASEVPAVLVDQRDRAAMDNLMAFYGMSDTVDIKTVTSIINQ